MSTVIYVFFSLFLAFSIFLKTVLFCFNYKMNWSFDTAVTDVMNYLSK